MDNRMTIEGPGPFQMPNAQAVGLTFTRGAGAIAVTVRLSFEERPDPVDFLLPMSPGQAMQLLALLQSVREQYGLSMPEGEIRRVGDYPYDAPPGGKRPE